MEVVPLSHEPLLAFHDGDLESFSHGTLGQQHLLEQALHLAPR
jgi:hypothetical protein